MSANNRARFFLILLTLVCVAPAAYAQGAPALYGIGIIVVDYPKFTNPKAAQECGLVREKLTELVTRTLLTYNIPAVEVKDAMPVEKGTARIHLTPEITSSQDSVLNCVSWIALIAEGRGAAVLPPVPERRLFIVSYWRGGNLVISSQSGHERGVNESLVALSRAFGQDYRLAQPGDGRLQSNEKSDEEKQKELIDKLREQTQDKILQQQTPSLKIPDAAPQEPTAP